MHIVSDNQVKGAQARYYQAKACAAAFLQNTWQLISWRSIKLYNPPSEQKSKLYGCHCERLALYREILP